MTQQLIHIANLGLNILNVRFQYKADIRVDCSEPLLPSESRHSLLIDDQLLMTDWRIRENLESIFDEEFDQFLDWLGALREELKKTEASDRRRRERLLEAVNGFALTANLQYPNSWKLSEEPELDQVGKAGG